MEENTNIYAPAQIEALIKNDNNTVLNPMSKCFGCTGPFSFPGKNQYCCYHPPIIVRDSTNDVILRVFPCEILYVAVENRQSVLYLIDREIRANNTITHWKNSLDPSIFVQPHYSFIVNLNYVSEMSKSYVKVRYWDKEYSIYTSSRKIGAFKKALLKFNKENK